MGGLSSPTGYLDLDQSMVTGADQTGTGTVDGVPVTVVGGNVDDGTVVEGGTVDVVVVVGATPVSGDTHPAGGAVAPV